MFARSLFYVRAYIRGCFRRISSRIKEAMKKLIASSMTLGLFAVLLTGCGKDANEPPPGYFNRTPPPAAPTPDHPLTKAEKIARVNASAAPEDVKKKAIEQINASPN